eukprot:s4693_g6.t1
MRLAIAAALTVAQRWIAAAVTVHSTVHSVSNEFNLDSIDHSDQSFAGKTLQPMELACGDEISGFRDGLTPGQPHIFCPITPSPIGRARAVTCGSSFTAEVSSNATIKDEVCVPACFAPCIEFIFRQVRRLKVLEEPAAGGTGSSTDGGSAQVTASSGVMLQLQLGPDVPGPDDGQLQPLFQDLGGDAGMGQPQPRRLDPDDEPLQQGGGNDGRLDFGHRQDDSLVLMGSQGRQLQLNGPNETGTRSKKNAPKPTQPKDVKGTDDAKSKKEPEKTSSPAEATGASDGQAEPMGEPAAEAASELLREATGLLKSIRGLKAMKLDDGVQGSHVRIKSVNEGQFGLPGQYALLDGGATHALMQAREDELEDLMPTQIDLAHGTTTLYRHPSHETLLPTSPVEPIIPLALMVAHGYRVAGGGVGAPFITMLEEPWNVT